jgi:HMG (high mobility group) box
VYNERFVGSPTNEALGQTGKTSDRSPTPPGQNERAGTETKRKYKRHPKPDKNAPERPPSAYVIFSNSIREEVRAQNLSFTDIAKLVGDRWQKLSPEEKEPFESKASDAKEKFHAELTQYKKTDSYKEYIQYTADFKVKHAATSSDVKRPKLEQDSDGGSGAIRSHEIMAQLRPKISTAHTRDISVGSGSSASYHSSFSPPKGASIGQPPSILGYSMSTNKSHMSALPLGDSPPLRPHGRESRLAAVLPVHNSHSTGSNQTWADLSEHHPHSGRLSQAFLPSGPISATADLSSANRMAAAVPMPSLQHHSSVSSVDQSDSSGASNALPVTPADESWRYPPADEKAKTSEWPRIQNPLLASNSSSYSTSFGPLPSLQPVDRIPDISRDLSQRTLPNPSASSPHEYKTFRALPCIQTPLPPSESSAGSPSEPRDELKSPVDSSEHDAANALAVLAYTRR